jgi:hypothetical protein
MRSVPKLFATAKSGFAALREIRENAALVEA